MELDSVRSLKSELINRLEKGISASATSVPRAYSMGGRRLRVGANKPHPMRDVALGISPGAGKRDFRLAVRIQRADLENAVSEFFFNAAAGEVDIRVTGEAFALAGHPNLKKQRPVCIGASVAHVNVTAGTAGCFPIYTKTGKRVLLSNNHILANTNSGKLGDPILQPSPADGGTVLNDMVGQLLDFVPLHPKKMNLVDAAIASLEGLVECDGEMLPQGGKYVGVRKVPVDLDEIVFKLGRTTNHTTGRITGIEVQNFPCRYGPGPGGVFRFSEQIEIEGIGQGPFSKPGDSGSLVTDVDGYGIGLVFCGTNAGGANGAGLSYANGLIQVFQALGLS